MNKKKKIQKAWISIYSFVIPTFVTAVYLVFSFFDFSLFVKVNSNKQPDIGSLLDGVITFVTIIMGVFGFLIPSLVSNKKDCGMIEFFLNSADQESFIKKLKLLVMSGMVTVLICLVLFLKDILKDWVFMFGMAFLVWFLLFFVCNAYRFIGIILSLLILNKEIDDSGVKNEAGKQVKSPMSEEESRKLKESISRQNGTP